MSDPDQDGVTGSKSKRRVSLALDTEFCIDPGHEDVVSVDLDGEWKTDAIISLHPEFNIPSLEMIDSEIGEGGDHMNITFKNVGSEKVIIPGDKIVLVVSEESEENAKDATTGPNAAEEPSKDDGSAAMEVDAINSGVEAEPQEIGEEKLKTPVASKNTENSFSVGDSIAAEVKDASEDVVAESVSVPPPFRDETQSTPDKSLGSSNDEVKSSSNLEGVVNGIDSLLSSETKDSEKGGDNCDSKLLEGDKSMENVDVMEEDSDSQSRELSDGQSKDNRDPMEEDSDSNTKDKGDHKVGDCEETVQNGNPLEEDSSIKEDEEKSTTPEANTIKMKFVDETVENDADKMDQTEKVNESKVSEESTKDKIKENEATPSPGLKLASFSTMDQKCVNDKKVLEPVKTDVSVGDSCKEVDGGARQDACSKCDKTIADTHRAIVWETMQFCDQNCLGLRQAAMDHCSSCNKSVASVSLGKYCVRFGSDIKQFCSNICLEDYKKGLKVCSYCQKDISGGEGFLAPIGDKGQFKDFCEQACLKKYEHIYLGKQPEPETLPCSVCKETKLVEREVLRKDEMVKLCSDPCFSAFKFVNSVNTLQCDLCTKHYDILLPKVLIYFDGISKTFCSKPCQNVFVMQNRKIVPCAYCKVKKYNFDMIEKFPSGQTSDSQLYCSLNCLNLHNMQMASKNGPSTFSPRPMTTTTGTSSATLPVISAVSSLASQPAQPSLPPVQQQIQVQTQTVREVLKETHILPGEQPTMRNKGLQTKPFMMTKGVSCRPHPCHKETQTEGLSQPTPIPIPVPIYVPTPCKMYNAPFPVPVPIPLPFPVPIFIPTTRNSMKGIEKIIKKILNKIPADPFEAELLALAGNVAGDKDSSDSDSEPENDRDMYDDMPVVPQQPPQDLENEMSGEKIVPKPLPVSTPDPLDRQRMMQGYNQQKRRQSGRDSDDDPDDPDQSWKPRSLYDQQQQQKKPPPQQRRTNTRGRGGSPAVKRFRQDQSSGNQQVQAIQQQPKERPDANHHLKFTYGVNAWKHWVVGKNAELEKQRAQGKYQKTFETDILKLRADELNFTLCMFVKEVKKPNGDSYAADSVFYLVLGIQEYLFENTRIDNIFTDVYYDPFTSALHEVVKDFKLPVNELGYFVTRIEEEHLWESKQLGAHSPHVLLNTLVYFNTKYFQLKTVDNHLKLSFSHIMKHWKKTPMANKPGQQQRTVLLRYYPPPAKGQKPEERKMYEQHENHDNPLRCPVKLYEFYLSKCPESTKNRNDMFYLQPERSCVPDSPVWYSAQLLNRFSMEKMLSRLLMVREVQEHMLADQSS